MPRCVRPSWVDIETEGRETTISTGPRRKNGSMSANFKVREKGRVVQGCSVYCWSDGRVNHLRVHDAEGKEVYRKDTEL